MIEQAEASGQLTPGKIVLEASSGNTAIGLAMVCAVKGYQLVVTMSESASEERKRILRAYRRANPLDARLSRHRRRHRRSLSSGA